MLVLSVVAACCAAALDDDDPNTAEPADEPAAAADEPTAVADEPHDAERAKPAADATIAIILINFMIIL